MLHEMGAQVKNELMPLVKFNEILKNNYFTDFGSEQCSLKMNKLI